MDLPTRLGNYELIELVGTGGQGSVYKAIDTALQRVVAVKIFSYGGGSPSGQQIAAFIYEARLASALDHPNICTIYSLVEDEPYTYMVMEFVEGKNVFELACGRPLESTLR